MTGDQRSYSLYFHIPFCTKKCDYCHFFVLPNKEPLKDLLLEGLEKEWALVKPSNRNLVSLYFGGGTPSLFSPERIKKVIDWIAPSSNVEITLEVNPEEVTTPLIQAYREAGINRISLGIQTLNDPLLVKLGRTHGQKQALHAIEATLKAGITNLSIDLMYDVPGQTLQDWTATLNEAVHYPITHLSLYNLTIEPHTVFFKHQDKLIKQLPDPETSLKMYAQAQETLTGAGLNQYEISAFAKPGFHSIHNTGYWTRREFLGLGPSAFSYWNHKRFRNVANLNKYTSTLAQNLLPLDFEEELPPEARLRELLAIELRLLKGVSLKGLPPDTLQALHKLAKEELLVLTDDTVKLSPRGILFYDTIAAEII